MTEPKCGETQATESSLGGAAAHSLLCEDAECITVEHRHKRANIYLHNHANNQSQIL